MSEPVTPPAHRRPPGTALWLEDVTPTRLDRPPLDGDVEADVAIVGAGYSGMWTAHYLLEHDPSLRIVIVEREFAGFGASGRNGGWCVGELAAGYDALAAAGGHAAAIALMRAMFDTVDEVGRVTSELGIECGFHRGGTIRLARTRPQLDRQRTEVSQYRRLGFDDDDLRPLDASEAEQTIAARGVLGGLHFSHTAALQPARLALGLAGSLVDRGVELFEHTTATTIGRGAVTTPFGSVRSPVVVQATEGYTRDLPGQRRALVPLYSLMIATEPLSDDVWASIGLADRPTFSDDRRLVIYGQRTADGRLAFGGRGAPYGWGSRIDPSIERRSRTHDLITATLRELLPQVVGADITHRWGGVLGVPRDWFPSVSFHRVAGIGRLGGYVGEGVAAANLAARTLADLIVGADTERTTYPWVDHRSRRWEPEPLRWLGINAGLRAVAVADRTEERTGRPSRVGRLADRLLG